jgi:hypothetical protein
MAIVQPPAPATPKPEPHAPVPPHAHKPVGKVDPFAALTALTAEAKRPGAGAKAKPLDHKDAINTLLGELTQVGRLGAPSVLRLELPESLDGQEVEVIVQVRKNGETIVEGRIQRNVPGKASTAKLTVELKQA